MGYNRIKQHLGKKREIELNRRMPDNVVRCAAIITLLGTCLLIPLILNPWGYNMFPSIRRLVLYLGMIAMAFFFLAWTIKGANIKPLRKPAAVLLLLLVTWLTVSTIFSVDPHTSFFGRFLRWEGLATWIAYAVVFLVSLMVFGGKRPLRWLMCAACAVSGLVSIFALFQLAGLHIIDWSNDLDLSRPFSTLGNPSILGGFLVMTLPLSLALVLEKEEVNGIRIAAAVSYVLQFAALVATQTRAAWLGAIVSLLVIIPSLIKNYQAAGRKMKLVAGTVMLIVVIALILTVSVTPSYRSRVASMTNMEEGTAHGRLLVWGQTIDLITHHAVLGTGLDTFALTGPHFWTVEEELELGRETMEDNPHNAFLQMGVAGGIIAIVLFALFLLTTLFYGIKACRKRENGNYASSFLLSSVSGFIVYLLFSFTSIDIAPLFFLLCGALVAVGNGNQQDEGQVGSVVPSKVQEKVVIATLAIGAVACVLVAIPLIKSVAADVSLHKALEKAAEGKNLEADESFKQAMDLDHAQYYLTARGQNLLEAARQRRDRTMVFEALELLERGVRDNAEDEHAHLYNADGLRMAGEWLDDRELLQRSIDEYVWILERDPNFYQAHLSLGASNALMGDMGRAMEEWLTAIPLSDKPIEAYLNLARAYKDAGNSSKSAEYYGKVLEIDPANQEAISAPK